MKKILFAVISSLIIYGCATGKECVKSCITISCPDGDELIMDIPYSQEEWDRIHKDGDSWTATFRCKRKEGMMDYFNGLQL